MTSKFNKVFQFLLCGIDIYSKYAWVVRLKYKNGITICNAFEQILDESNRKSDKIWVYKGRELYNTSMKSWLQDNDIAMYSKHNERNTVVAETVMTSVSKHVYIDKLDEIVN